jgi:hypothetical protein
MGKLRLGLYECDPDDNRVWFVGQDYRDTPSDIAMMREVIKEFNRCSARRSARNKKHTRCLGIFPVVSKAKRKARK